MRKVSARWVPHPFTSDQAERRLEIATANRSRFDTKGENVLSRIVAIDEKWVRSYDPKLKRQSAEWHTPSSPRPAKVRRVQSKLKIFMIYPASILYKSITGRYRPVSYPDGPITARNRFIKYAYWVPIKLMLIKRWMVNTTRSIFKSTSGQRLITWQRLAAQNGWADVTNWPVKWELLDHPPYSPDISSCDNNLFPKLK